MILKLQRLLAVVVSVCIVGTGIPRPGRADTAIKRGAATPERAGALENTDAGSPTPLAEAARAGLPVLALGALAAATSEPDTTDFDFPEEEKKHLARDITAWIIGSAFVAFFIVKVFIEKDKETPPDNSPPHKTIP